MRQLTLFILSVFFLASCNSKETTQSTSYQLGELKHQFPISEAALPSFDKGLLFLHSFEYEDALEAFLAAQQADPKEMMAYWGEAMCYYKALWGMQDVTAGRAVMAKLGADQETRLLKAENELERDFWKGIEWLYGEGEFLVRNTKYVTHMAELYEKYPGNQEVAAFYALGLIWATDDNNEAEFMQTASEVVMGITRENPTHPGALHYMIHANDNPQDAEAARNAADEYAQVAPDAAHALHMPSHIYVALGMWNEVVNSNTNAYGASIRRMERKKLDGTARDYHSMAWLHYGYLQQGNYDQAAILLKEMLEYYKTGMHSSRYLITMQNEQRIESGRWPEEIIPAEVDYKGLGLSDKSGFHFFKALLAYDRKDAAAIANEIEELAKHLDIAKLQVTDNGLALCSAGPTNYAPNRESINKTNVILHQMEALKAMASDNLTLTEMHLKEAIQLEEKESYDSGPPFIAYPSFEQYGDWLLMQNRAEEALSQFEKSLTNRKNRAHALRGKIEALTRLNRIAEARETQQLLDVFWQKEV